MIEPVDLAVDQRAIAGKLVVLASTLPPRFFPIVSNLQRNLHWLYSLEYHQVLTQWDLCAMNILVSLETGRITGIVDWAEARVQPFGFALWGLENLFGEMRADRWKESESRLDLRHLFWERFSTLIDVENNDLKSRLGRKIRLARDIGILIQRGFTWENGVNVRPVTDGDASSIRYLDAFLSVSQGDNAAEGGWTYGRSRHFWLLNPDRLR